MWDRDSISEWGRRPRIGLLPILVTGEFARIQQGISEPEVGPGAPPWWEKGVKRGDLESLGFFCGLDGKESAGLMLGLGRSPGEGNGYPLQYSWASLVVLMVQVVKKKPSCNAGDLGSIPRWGRFLAWRRALSGFCDESAFPASGQGSAWQRCCTGKQRNSPQVLLYLAPWLAKHLRITEDLSPLLFGTSSGRHSPAAKLPSWWT